MITTLFRACTQALNVMGEGACTAVETAICILEDEVCLNAGKCYKPVIYIMKLNYSGYGSNLTADGKVECDAAIMDGRTGDFGSVGALSGAYPPTKFSYIRPEP